MENKIQEEPTKTKEELLKKKKFKKKLKKTRKEIAILLDESKYYEAQQLFQTLSNRYRTRKYYNEALIICKEGIILMNKVDKPNCAMDLCRDVIKIYRQSNRECNDESINDLLELFNGFIEYKFSNESDAPLIFMNDAIEWSKDKGGNVSGNSKLRLGAAKFCMKIKDYGKAQKHYLFSDSPKEHVKCLIEWSKEGYKNERDLFIARSVLEYIENEHLEGANIIFNEYYKHYKNDLDTPLIRFIEFLLQTMEREAAPLFSVLCKKYRISLERDSDLMELLERIGEQYFNIQKQKGMLESLVSSFFNDEN